jgi:hypothetical protein
MEEGMTIAKVPDWMELKPEMMRHLIREHEKLGRTLTEEETVTLLRSLGFEISERSDEERRTPLRAEIPRFECNCEASARFTHDEPVIKLNQLVGALAPFFL